MLAVFRLWSRPALRIVEPAIIDRCVSRLMPRIEPLTSDQRTMRNPQTSSHHISAAPCLFAAGSKAE